MATTAIDINDTVQAETLCNDISTSLLTSVSPAPQHTLAHTQRNAQAELETLEEREEKAVTLNRKDSKTTVWCEEATTPPIRISMAEDDVAGNIEHEKEPDHVEENSVETQDATDEAPDTPKAAIEATTQHNSNDAETLDTSTLSTSPEEAAQPSKHNSLTPSLDSDTTKAQPSKARPLSQRFMAAPQNGRDRSASPGRFPVRVEGAATSRSTSPAPAPGSGQVSPVKRLSVDVVNGTEADLQAQSSSSQSGDQPSPGMFRKASSGFGGLLGRMGNIRKTALSPPPTKRVGTIDRRNSGNSTGGYDHSTAASLAAIVDGPEDAHRPTLQDRFRTLREQEEHQEEEDEEGDLEHDPLDEATSETHSTAEKALTRTKRASSTQSQLKSPPLNPDLPPGTASGMSAGPARDPAPVNWDLWQTVVCEGPAAVARTSGEELSKAIASGIPPAIRGVVWQVLAESKSDELEALYKTLKTRGAEPESKPLPTPRPESEVVSPEKERPLSSRSSSIHSTSSTPAASSITTPPASVDGADVQHKLLAEKHKRETAAIQKLEKAIKRDLGSRTSYSKYTQSAGLQDGLFGVCKAYALFDTHVGYAQGINFIAMPLLFNMSEEEAFTLLVKMMHHFHLRTLFEPEMPGLHLRLYQFERLLEEREPALYCHLKRRHVSPQLYATQWFLTLFAYRFPLQLVLRVYDLLFSEGLTAILKFGLVLMQKNRAALLEMKDMSHLTTFLKEKLFDVYIDKSPSASSILDSGFFGSVSGGADKELYRADELVQDATQIKITPEQLHAYEVEWEEIRKTERDREAEVELLRSTNISLATKVKALEERVQQHDQEHVGIASDLVKYKVENDTLHDTKEALEIRVLELQKMVDAQPAEVEAKLKSEMDRIMQRNLEVQNENRHLQDELENAEQQLIKISMTHAETQADFDTLKQKWSGLQAMMNGK